MKYSIPWILSIYQRKWIGKNEFSIRKNQILNPLRIPSMHNTRIFGLNKGSAGYTMCLIYCNEKILFGFLYFWGFLRPWKLTSSEHWINFFSVFVSLMTYLGYIVLLDLSIFTTIDDGKVEKINSSIQVLLKDFTT